MNILRIWKRPGHDGAHRTVAFLLRDADNRRSVCATTGVDRLSVEEQKLAFSNEMPPLMSIERKMFHITQIGVVLLTLTLCTGLFYMHNLFSMENIDKAVLSIVAWFVYIVLLWGITMRAGGVVGSCGLTSQARVF